MSIRAKRGTRAQVDAAASAASLKTGEMFYLTDVAQFAVAVSSSGYVDLSHIASQAEAEAGTNNTNVMTPLRGAQQLTALLPVDPFSARLLHVRDEKASGTNGGTSAASAWNIRTLNTVLTNEIAGASLLSDQITLPAGSYYIDTTAPSNATNQSQLRVYNVTDIAVILRGPGAAVFASTQVPSSAFGRFTLLAQKTLRLEHYTAAAVTSTGLGFACSTGAGEVYADVRIWKVA